MNTTISTGSSDLLQGKICTPSFTLTLRAVSPSLSLPSLADHALTHSLRIFGLPFFVGEAETERMVLWYVFVLCALCLFMRNAFVPACQVVGAFVHMQYINYCVIIQSTSSGASSRTSTACTTLTPAAAVRILPNNIYVDCNTYYINPMTCTFPKTNSCFIYTTTDYSFFSSLFFITTKNLELIFPQQKLNSPQQKLWWRANTALA